MRKKFQESITTYIFMWLSFLLLTSISIVLLILMQKNTFTINEKQIQYLNKVLSIIATSISGGLFIITFIIRFAKKSFITKVNNIGPGMRFALSQMLPLCSFFGLWLTLLLLPLITFYAFIALGSGVLVGIIFLLLIPDFCLKDTTSYTFTISKRYVKVSRYEKNIDFKWALLQKTTTYYRYDEFLTKETKFIFDNISQTISIEGTSYFVKCSSKTMYETFKKEIYELQN